MVSECAAASGRLRKSTELKGVIKFPRGRPFPFIISHNDEQKGPIRKRCETRLAVNEPSDWRWFSRLYYWRASCGFRLTTTG
ncbi:hypothetical protein ElyMa_003142300 [Elysia marginata]|uniref:Uncharacterized protein n=1 Tax=Elysia marginata TaxID=1093978 RepID=A0AAV4ITB0_9GAST|nr:hypothetical protein ElyMa_003142300 [Elysia marginata]